MRDQGSEYMAFEMSRRLEVIHADFRAYSAAIEWAIEPHAIGPERREVEDLRLAVLAILGGGR